MSNEMTFEQHLKLLSDRSVPIVIVDGAVDEPATVRQILLALGMADDRPAVKELIYTWDCVSGLEISGTTSRFKVAEDLMAAVKADPDRMDSTAPKRMLTACANMASYLVEKGNPEGVSTAVVIFTGDRILSTENEKLLECMQLLMNMRDDLTLARMTLFFVGIDFVIPPELKEHVRIIESPLPTESEVMEHIDKAYQSYTENYDSSRGDEKFLLTEDTKKAFASALKGIPHYQVSQNLFLAMDNRGIHLNRLRENAIKTLNKQKGLSVTTNNIRGFDDIGGLYSLKQYMRECLAGRLNPEIILFVDEIEKGIAGSGGGDTSGVSSSFLGTILSEMVDTKSLGLLQTGVYGCGKSMFSAALGAETGAIFVHLDIAGMKDSLVGSSEANLRQALKIIRSIGGTDGGIMWVATSNRIGQLPPELKSRFGLGTYFFDLPREEERNLIWNMHLQKYFPGHEPFERNTLGFDDDGWSGREIEACCRLAWMMNSELDHAARRITPVSVTAAHEIDILRKEADGVFLDATFDGVYRINRKVDTAPRSSASVPQVKVRL